MTCTEHEEHEKTQKGRTSMLGGECVTSCVLDDSIPIAERPVECSYFAEVGLFGGSQHQYGMLGLDPSLWPLRNGWVTVEPQQIQIILLGVIVPT